MIEHGGNIYRASRETGIPEERIIDFSASINPLGVPRSVVVEIKKTIGRLPHYPEPYAEPLGARIAQRLDTNPESVVCGNGSTELIYLIARVFHPGKALIPAPTFSEYERACNAVGIRVVGLPLERRENFDVRTESFIKAMKGCGMAFLCNPNNPTGRIVEKDDVLEIAEAAKKLKCLLVVDEAFIDFSPDASVIDEVKKNPFLVVLRSLTKFYALSGLRIGYVVFPPPLAKVVRKLKEPWTVNSLALKAGIAALADRDFEEKTFRFMKREKGFVEKELRNLGIDYLPSVANFYLLHINNGKKAIASLLKKGILVRDCSNFKGLDGSHIRIAVKSRRDNALLLKELSRL